ncbi:hypothetical protein VTL71DRAFT_9049 [Oculimacula yallundae]|uniref:Uncharacterized protein n=1 Tax=Oculimacula yallundae TaxID=86028 RepID=A0ABR4BTM4_9HELO
MVVLGLAICNQPLAGLSSSKCPIASRSWKPVTTRLSTEERPLSTRAKPSSQAKTHDREFFKTAPFRHDT